MDSMFLYASFNSDISQWDVGNVITMASMFHCSLFNRDLASWNTANVQTMQYMFGFSIFTGDISRWCVKNVSNMWGMFSNSEFNGNISSWDVSSVQTMSHMFWNSRLTTDISSWDVANCRNFVKMFHLGFFIGDISKWAISCGADIDQCLDMHRAALFKKPTVFHWRLVFENPNIMESWPIKWKEHIDNLRSIVQGVASSEMEAAIILQEYWLRDAYDSETTKQLQLFNFENIW